MRDNCYRNACYFGADGAFHHGGFAIQDGRFADVGRCDLGVDLHGAMVIPGLLDIHTHGNSGHDFSSCSVDELAGIARSHAAMGVAGFCPTSMTLPQEQLERAFAHAAKLRRDPPKGAARVLGINMEGPFLAPSRKGAQNAAYLRQPDITLFRRLQQAAEGCIRIVDIAPELEGAPGFIGAVKSGVIVSLAHSDASYDQACAGFDAGITHVTHLFNAMPGLHHRKPGPLAAAAERANVVVELVADGVHLHPSIVRLSFALFGARRICLVSDSMEACGMPDGTYSLGGQEVHVRDMKATLADGTIAGSATPVIRCLQNVAAWGVPVADAVRAATLTPAERLGITDSYGAIADARRASFLVVNEALDIIENHACIGGD